MSNINEHNNINIKYDVLDKVTGPNMLWLWEK